MSPRNLVVGLVVVGLLMSMAPAAEPWQVTVEVDKIVCRPGESGTARVLIQAPEGQGRALVLQSWLMWWR